MNKWIKPVVLNGEHVILKPLELSQCKALQNAVCDGELWKLWYTRIPEPDQMTAEICRRLELQQQGAMLPFYVEDRHSGQAIGMTSFMNIEAVHRRVEIGSTWYRKTAQRTPVNTECKKLLLSHAFDTLDCIAVEFRTSSFNFKSQAAIQRLGAKLDGVLRSHQIVENDILRDTHVYSILRNEWPAVHQHLQWLLTQPRSISS
ncbi:GNAT family N-acetyltransferase [Acinetobacter qingfengensis]|uniref:Amino acid acetyltransferase n=1 Tax=Acinetobacter qingfengensis TaxID=1262585 RepID=A0A1E7RC71_9GAMM|nr:GNAT family protein [Acinetobacter qingfengensis]KAA8734841.1 GNAT family N-acetyltransferase [Acinetobacter qingfengensis]OEY96883.1 amino acid acetyltransferase [Acinetobacter qingfengensis]